MSWHLKWISLTKGQQWGKYDHVMINPLADQVLWTTSWNAFLLTIMFVSFYSWWRHPKWKHFPRYWLFVKGIPGHRWIPLTKASDAELWFFFYLRLNKRFSKQSRRRRFETPSRSFWRHCNVIFVPEGRIDNESELIEVLAWYREGDNPSTEPNTTWFTDAYMRHQGPF